MGLFFSALYSVFACESCCVGAAIFPSFLLSLSFEVDAFEQFTCLAVKCKRIIIFFFCNFLSQQFLSLDRLLRSGNHKVLQRFFSLGLEFSPQKTTKKQRERKKSFHFYDDEEMIV